MSYLQDITARFPVRKRDEEKEAFRKWAVAQGKTLGYSARVEELARGRHCNVVFGSPEHAQVIYTAHYDTPARLPIPNLMTPRNIPMFALYQLGIILALLLIAVIAFGRAVADAQCKPVADHRPAGLLCAAFADDCRAG